MIICHSVRKYLTRFATVVKIEEGGVADYHNWLPSYLRIGLSTVDQPKENRMTSFRWAVASQVIALGIAMLVGNMAWVNMAMGGLVALATLDVLTKMEEKS